MIAEPAFDDDGPPASEIAAFYAGMTPFWHPVLSAAALHDRPVGVRLLGRRLVLARLDGGLLVMPDTCRHFQAQLSLGTVVRCGDRDGLQCPYHGWTFGSDGTCIRIPQLAAGRAIPAKADLPTFRSQERYGLIWVCLTPEATFPIPAFPEYDDAAFHKVTLDEAQPTRTSATRMIMGTLDDTHFPWVHEGILGDRDHPEPPDHRARREANELIVEYETEQPAGLATAALDGDAAGASVKVAYADHVGMPNVIRLVKDMDTGRYVIWLATCPLDYCTTRNFWVFARNFDRDPARDSVYEAMSAHVRLQDKPIVESQRPWLIPPFWTQIEMPMGPGDLPLIQYQKWLEDLGIATRV